MDINNFLPVFDISSIKSVLCIQPHPDDNEVGAGGTISYLAEMGCRVEYLTVTDGRLGTIDPTLKPDDLVKIRRQETINAANIIGVSKQHFLDFHDGSYMDEKDLCLKIVSAIREIKPDMVMTVDPFLPYEAHADHRRVGMAAAEACLSSGFPHFSSYNMPAPVENTWDVKWVAFYNTAYPNTFIDVSSTWDKKMNAITAHNSQFSGESFEMLKGYFDYKARELAQGRGFERAEGFKVLTPMLMHANVDAIHM